MEPIVLDVSHTDDVINLLKNRDRFSKQYKSEEVWNTLLNGSLECLNDGKLNRIIGSYQDGVLKAIVGQSFSRVHPIWNMKYYATDINDISLSTGYGEHLDVCFGKAMLDAEELGYYDIWYSVPEKYSKTGPRLLKTSKEWSRYEMYTDAIIPAGEYPKYQLHQIAYGRVLKPHAVFIRHAVLKQEFRPIPLSR